MTNTDNNLRAERILLAHKALDILNKVLDLLAADEAMDSQGNANGNDSIRESQTEATASHDSARESQADATASHVATPPVATVSEGLSESSVNCRPITNHGLEAMPAGAGCHDGHADLTARAPTPHKERDVSLTELWERSMTAFSCAFSP
jgi:hypothetical protein